MSKPCWLDLASRQCKGILMQLFEQLITLVCERSDLAKSKQRIIYLYNNNNN